MSRATIIYWTGEDEIRLDGGGQRAMSWKHALEQAGYTTEIVGLWTANSHGSTTHRLSSLKRMLVPMPFERPIPRFGETDLVVATVPAVFRDAARRVPPGRLIFDWMDLWSHNARNVGDAAWSSVAGGRIQSRLWRLRERSLPHAARMNTYAGYRDWETSSRANDPGSGWLPNVAAHFKPRSEITPRVRRVGFVGSMNYPPNELSLRWFFKEYGSALSSRGIEVVVAGFGSERVESWGVPATVIGEVADLDHFYSNIDAAVVPIVHGGGIKAKAIEALSYGLPVFGTEHVRSGFAPELRHWVLDIEEMLAQGAALPSSIPADEFARSFSQSAFDRAVGGLLERS